LVGAEPVKFGDLAVSVTTVRTEASSEDDAGELDDPTVWVAADLSLRVAQHGDDAVEFNLEAEFLEAFSTGAVGKRFARFESAAG
jgi:hypothetical protein